MYLVKNCKTSLSNVESSILTINTVCLEIRGTGNFSLWVMLGTMKINGVCNTGYTKQGWTRRTEATKDFFDKGSKFSPEGSQRLDPLPHPSPPLFMIQKPFSTPANDF